MADPSLNIRSEITRIRGVAQPPGAAASGKSDNSALIGPVPPQQLLANALSAIQDFANTLAQRVIALAASIAAIGSISASGGKIAFQNCTVTVTVDEAGNLLVFTVKYSDGVTIKTGTVALT